MMNAHDQCLATRVIVDQLHLPQRLGFIERPRSELPNEFLEIADRAAAGQLAANQMVFQIELVDLLPIAAGRIAHHATAKLPMRHQTSSQQVAQACEVDFPVELVDADDHHQILGRIHPQPCGVDGRHPFTHRRSLPCS